MLEIRNLVKTYSTKGGVTVRALDDVTVTFPEKGMVFLLGRSGSGKSTLLNVSGGLDKPDSGEIIVKGRSSKDFSESDFDSYRNTYVGFIFQEYNILNEFTVEQNIALALQLQNKPNDKKAVERLLEQVDLKGLGKRKPNTLSGGQKQRVAIARALIKEPEIIMADEPTGALDSNTGRQVLDTLKKLSENKLVVVVSHDREFAKHYGDRVIELADGKIISDISKDKAKPENITNNLLMISDDTISIKDTEKVTEEEVKSILSILKKKKGEAIITSGSETLGEIKKVCKVDEDGNREYFKATEKVDVKEYDGKQTKFIKSRLPMGHALKMGASGLKTKPIRLIFTILLSVVAFAMFGIASTLMLYDSSFSISKALIDANNPSITLSKEHTITMQSIRIDNETGESTIDGEYESTKSALFGVQETLDKSVSGLDYAGVFNFMGDKENALDARVKFRFIHSGFNFEIKTESNYYPVTDLLGFSDCGEAYMLRNGYSLVGQGKYPTENNEVAISKYFAELIISNEDFKLQNVEELIGRKISFNDCKAISERKEFTIVGIYDAGYIDPKYDDLKNKNSNISQIERQQLTSSLADYLNNSLHTVIFVSEGFYDEYSKNIPESLGGTYMASLPVKGFGISDSPIEYDVKDNYMNFYTDVNAKAYSYLFKFYNSKGEEISFSIADNEVFISKYAFDRPYYQRIENLAMELSQLSYYDEEAINIFGHYDYFYQLYNEGKYDEVIDILNEWYQKLKLKELYARTANNFRYSLDLNGVYPEDFDKFALACDELNHFSPWGSDPVYPSKDAWDTIEDFMNKHLKTYCPQIFYGGLFIELNSVMSDKYNNYNYGNDFVDELEFYHILDGLLCNSLSDEHFAIVKERIDRDYATYLSVEIDGWLNLFIPDYSYAPITEMFYKNYFGQTGTLIVKGYYEIDAIGDVGYLLSKNFLTSNAEVISEEQYSWSYNELTDYVAPADERYNYIVSKTQNTQEQIQAVLEASGVVSYRIRGEVFESLVTFIELINNMKTIFLIAGIIFGVFAGLMLVNFISVSISAKRKDIGILRAVGARGTDVFKIFFSEASIIAFICFILATIVSYIVCQVLNTEFSTIVSMSLLNFGVINVLMILVISFAVSLIATFLPVFFASKKSPVESIRAL